MYLYTFSNTLGGGRQCVTDNSIDTESNTQVPLLSYDSIGTFHSISNLSESCSSLSDLAIYGKGFIHYALPIRVSSRTSEPNGDNVSNVSSFRMDADVISLEAAEYKAQLYSNNNTYLAVKYTDAYHATADRFV